MADDYKFNKRVTLCFNYFQKFNKSDDSPSPFNLGDIESVYNKLVELKTINSKDPHLRDKFRFRELVKIEELKKPNDRTIVGVYKQTYWGQAFENEDYGKISADSINWRPFFFALYLSETGSIYLISQFLGSYGGYSTLRRVISSYFPLFNMRFHAINTSLDDIDAINVKEVNITLSSRGDKIESSNFKQQVAALSFTKSPDDLKFDDKVRQKILPHIGKDKKKIRDEIASLIGNKLITFNSDDIEDCSLIVTTDRKRQFTIALFDEELGPSRILANVGLDADGNPYFEELEKIAFEMLDDRILGKIEDV